MDTRICSKCQQEKPLAEFREFTRPTGKKEYRRECKKCATEYIRQRRKANPEKCLQEQRTYNKSHKQEIIQWTRIYRSTRQEHINKNHRIWMNRPDVIHRMWAKQSINTHRIKGYEIYITLEELTKLAQETIACPMCGLQLKWKYGVGVTERSPTLDRINNGKTLELHNVWIICRTCNYHKSNKSMKDFIAYCKTIAAKYG
jgi:hypothetical protein